MAIFSMSRLRAGFSGVIMMFAAGSLTGCGGIDGIEFEGALFEAAGLTNIGKKTGDRDVKPRAPLVVPPSAKLITPGENDPGAGQVAWPVDPDQKKIAVAAQAEAERKRKCRDGVFAKGVKAKPEDYEQLSQGGPACDSILHTIINKPIQQPNQ